MKSSQVFPSPPIKADLQKTDGSGELQDQIRARAFQLYEQRGRVMDTGHPHTISLKLRDVNQLFNSMDPSPFIEKDLDDDAEEFIVSWAQEFSPKTLLKLRIYLDQWPAEDPKRTDQDSHPQPLCSQRPNCWLGVQATPQAGPHKFFHRADVLGWLSTSQR